MENDDSDTRRELEATRRARLFDLIRQQDQTDAPVAALIEEQLPAGFAQHFKDSAAKSLGRRAPDRMLSLNLRRR